MSTPDKAELRVMMERDLLSALDMIALSQGGMPRSDLVESVLRRYVVAKQRAATLIAKGPQINPAPSDSEWSALG